MAALVQYLSSSLSLDSRFHGLSLKCPSTSSASVRPTVAPATSLSFSSSLSRNVFSTGSLTVQKPMRLNIVCVAAPKRKTDSGAKRARQSEKRRIYNKARKSEIKTRMKTVLEALDALRKKQDAQPEEILSIEKLIGQAYSVIDKAVKVGTLHRNTGARRKSRLARRKKAVETHHGWYTPDTPVAT